MTGRYLQAGEEGSWASILQVAQDGNDFLICSFFFFKWFSVTLSSAIFTSNKPQILVTKKKPSDFTYK